MIAARLAHLLGLDRTSSTLRANVPGAASGGDILCAFSSFDAQSELPDYVTSYLRELRRQGCDIIFVTTSPQLSDTVVQKLSPYCSRIVHRQNRGLDFASWKLGISLQPAAAKYRAILLANDSMLGPLRPLDKEFAALRQENGTVLGLTDSTEFDPHLQSYFLYFPNDVFNSPAFQKFWKRVAALTDKGEIIRRYEVGLSRHLRDIGVHFRALFPQQDLKKSAAALGDGFEFKDRMDAGKCMNPTLHYWEILVDEFDFPFVKRGILVNCPVALRGIPKFLAKLKQCRTPIAAEILCYLNRDATCNLPT